MLRHAQVSIGRGADNTLAVEDNEVSGRHAVVLWDAATRNWQARDMGSLNGTRLNGNFINNSVRRPGKPHRLNTDDILLLGSRTAIKVAPSLSAEREMRNHWPLHGQHQSRCLICGRM